MCIMHKDDRYRDDVASIQESDVQPSTISSFIKTIFPPVRKIFSQKPEENYQRGFHQKGFYVESYATLYETNRTLKCLSRMSLLTGFTTAGPTAIACRFYDDECCHDLLCISDFTKEELIGDKSFFTTGKSTAISQDPHVFFIPTRFTSFDVFKEGNILYNLTDFVHSYIPGIRSPITHVSKNVQIVKPPNLAEFSGYWAIYLKPSIFEKNITEESTFIQIANTTVPIKMVYDIYGIDEHSKPHKIGELTLDGVPVKDLQGTSVLSYQHIIPDIEDKLVDNTNFSDERMYEIANTYSYGSRYWGSQLKEQSTLKADVEYQNLTDGEKKIITEWNKLKYQVDTKRYYTLKKERKCPLNFDK